MNLKSNINDMMKAFGKKDISKLTKKKVTTKRGHQTTVYVREGEKPKQAKEKGIIQIIMEFFGFKHDYQVKQHMAQEFTDYKAQAKEKQEKAPERESFLAHYAEYFRHKDRWDSKLTGKAAPKGEAAKTGEKSAARSEAAKGERQKRAWDMSIMKYLHGKYGKHEKAESAEKGPQEKTYTVRDKQDKSRTAQVIAKDETEAMDKGASALKTTQVAVSEKKKAGTPEQQLAERKAINAMKENRNNLERRLEKMKWIPDVRADNTKYEKMRKDLSDLKKKIETAEAEYNKKYPEEEEKAPGTSGKFETIGKDIPHAELIGQKVILPNAKGNNVAYYVVSANKSGISLTDHKGGTVIRSMMHGQFDKLLAEAKGKGAEADEKWSEERAAKPGEIEYSDPVQKMADKNNWGDWLDVSDRKIMDQMEKLQSKQNKEDYQDFVSFGNAVLAERNAAKREKEVKSDEKNRLGDLLKKHNLSDADVKKYAGKTIDEIATDLESKDIPTRDANTMSVLITGGKTKAPDNFETMPESEGGKEKEKPAAAPKAKGKEAEAETGELKQYTDPDTDVKYHYGDENGAIKKTGNPNRALYPGKTDPLFHRMEPMLSDDAKKKGVWSNTKLALYDKKLAEQLIDEGRKKLYPGRELKGQAPDFDRVKPPEDFKKTYSDMTFLHAKQSSGKDTPPKAYYKSGNDVVAIDANSIAVVKKYFPDAKFHYSGKETQPVAITSGGNFIGVVMPMQMKDKEGVKTRHAYITGQKTDTEKYKEELKKHEQDLKTGKIPEIYAMHNTRNADGSLKSPPSHPAISMKNIKDGYERKLFEKMKVKNQILENKIKPVFDMSKDGQDAGVWTDTRMLIMDKGVADSIYNTNKRREFLRLKKSNPKNSDEEIAKSIEDTAANAGTFPNWEPIVKQAEGDIGKNEATFTGNHKGDPGVPVGQVMEYSDGEKTAYFNPQYIATIKNRFPDAKFYISGPLSPGVFKVNGETKALLMPVQPSKDGSIEGLGKLEKATRMQAIINGLYKAYPEKRDSIDVEYQEARKIEKAEMVYGTIRREDGRLLLKAFGRKDVSKLRKEQVMTKKGTMTTVYKKPGASERALTDVHNRIMMQKIAEKAKKSESEKKEKGIPTKNEIIDGLESSAKYDDKGRASYSFTDPHGNKWSVKEVRGGIDVTGPIEGKHNFAELHNVAEFISSKIKGGSKSLEKAFGKRDTAKLVKKQVTDKRGRRTTVYVDPNEGKPEPKPAPKPGDSGVSGAKRNVEEAKSEKWKARKDAIKNSLRSLVDTLLKPMQGEQAEGEAQQAVGEAAQGAQKAGEAVKKQGKAEKTLAEKQAEAKKAAAEAKKNPEKKTMKMSDVADMALSSATGYDVTKKKHMKEGEQLTIDLN